MTITEHRRKAFDADLRDLVHMIAEMGGHAEKQIAECIDALAKRDGECAQRVVAADAIVDALQHEIEERAVATTATRQPMAVNLREVIGILRIANDLERIGDLAKNIGKRVIVLNGEDMPRQAIRGVKHMAALTLRQLRDVLDSFAQRDSTKAIAVWTRDEEIDTMYTSLFRELLTYMNEDPATISFGIHLLFCAKNIERMGDHATNIAEAVHYMVEGHSLSNERPKADLTSEIAVVFNT